MNNSLSEEFKRRTIDSWIDRNKENKIESYLLKTYAKDNTLQIIDAGCGGGYLPVYMEKVLGFKHVTAFDIIPEMIEKAKERAKQQHSNVRFILADASNLNCFEDKQFNYLVYLEQILCMIPHERFNEALQEAYRIGTTDSTYIFSFLDWKSRWYNPILSFILNFIRFLTGRQIQKYYMPQLRFNGLINWGFFLKNQHPILWAKKGYLVKKLLKTGFVIESFYKQEELTKSKGTRLYFVCKKKNLSVQTY